MSKQTGDSQGLDLHSDDGTERKEQRDPVEASRLFDLNVELGRHTEVTRQTVEVSVTKTVPEPSSGTYSVKDLNKDGSK